MKLAVFSHCVIDSIKIGDASYEQVGGPACYCSWTARNLKGVKYVLFTNKREISMLDKDRIYSLTLPNREIYDTTGIGDIFSSTFCSTFLKEKDSIWAFCFASGAAQAAIESKKVGLEKVPKKGATETNATYFYNAISRFEF